MIFIKAFESYRSDLEILEMIKKRYFQSSSIDVDIKQLDGYERKGDKMVFGSSLNYNNFDIYYLMHEMGHFVTTRKFDRLLKSHYGLSYTTKDTYDGVDYYFPISWSGVKNELKATAYQELLGIEFTGKFPLENWMKSLKLLEDFTNVPPKNAQRNPEGVDWIDIETGSVVKFSELEGRRMETMMEWYNMWKEKNHSLLNMSGFNKKWFERVDYLEQNL